MYILFPQSKRCYHVQVIHTSLLGCIVLQLVCTPRPIYPSGATLVPCIYIYIYIYTIPRKNRELDPHIDTSRATLEKTMEIHHGHRKEFARK